MISLNVENLNDVNLFLERLEAQDRFIEAKIELFEKTENNNYSKSDKCTNNSSVFIDNLVKNKIPNSFSSTTFQVNTNIPTECTKNEQTTSTNKNTEVVPEVISPSDFLNDLKQIKKVNKNKKIQKINKKKTIELIKTEKEETYILPYIINILNYVFPDYEFKYLNKSNYKYIKNINKVIDNINYNLFYIIENVHRGFNKRIWKILKDLIDFKYCDVYTYLNDVDKDPYMDKHCISCFNYFFFAKKNNRILFISCITKPKYKTPNDGEFNNMYVSLQEDELPINDYVECDEEESSHCYISS
ncbi:repressor of RNA polymerase III transcription MAF1, putative [Hepatocystis sp. ex Piliocolobus tephrosceles]|nr:repressor of RNA polymerase III transcription MAF1, putative [Hepatocystis sp. ex Piliocolobus tephrosceles]